MDGARDLSMGGAIAGEERGKRMKQKKSKETERNRKD